MINLHKPALTVGGKVLNFGIAFVALLIWTKVVFDIYRWLFSLYPDFTSQIFHMEYNHKDLVMFYLFCIAPPIAEEIVFRYAPLQIVRVLGRKDLCWPVILLSSVIFAWMHKGEFNIFVQGALGVTVSILYIKNNYSFLSIALFHALWNFMILSNIYTFN